MLIELSGTPSAGKKTVMGRVSRSLNTDYKVVQAADRIFDIGNSNFELKNLWTIFDTYSKIERVLSTQPKVENLTIFLNRGLFDRIAWARLLKFSDDCFEDISRHLERWLITQLSELNTKENYGIFLFLTNYEKIIKRNPRYTATPGSVKPWVVNVDTINRLNSIYQDLYNELRDEMSITLIDDQGDDFGLENKVQVVMKYLDKAIQAEVISPL